MKPFAIKGTIALLVIAALGSCKKYLDVIPDNVATIDNAFTMRSQAMKFLFTCYSYMPKDADLSDNPAIAGGDELWSVPARGAYFNIAKGFQNVVAPYGDRWTALYRALRDCNIFLENIDRVPDMDEAEKRRWVAEVKFLKAYYHFYLVRMYGPVPLIKVNQPIDADAEMVRMKRTPVDSCFQYITQLLDEAKTDLPFLITDPINEMGRITTPIALSFKAKVLVTAASPLFNGNTDQAALKNPDGTPLFATEFSKVKWDSAAAACKAAIEACDQAGFKLYQYQNEFPQFSLSDTIITQMSIRNSFAQKWNTEIIWANTQTNTQALQTLITTWLDPLYVDGSSIRGELSPPLKMAETFYTSHGIPIAEDNTWNYAGRYALRKATEQDKLYIRRDYTTAGLNFDREPRFYATLGFDGSVWYGQGKYDDKKDQELFYIAGKFKERNGRNKEGYGTVTGYFIKKLIHYQNVIGASNAYSVNAYPWPLIRLSDLYLLYAEALNESQGPVADVHTYLNRVRSRAGLPSVEYAWSHYSTNNAKYTTVNGMRDIIQQERTIELALEGHRFWDLRRWKKAATEMNAPIRGWDLSQETAAAYYRPTVVFNQTFGLKDYFWPISEPNITANRNLVQNLGW